ncbi:MAG: DUF2088 domain-containing protein [Planctomycetes bacterium]|nr:DUF2088 domain-containing protein [Planctomycetota bacterium]
MVFGEARDEGTLAEDEIRALVARAADAIEPDGRRIVVLIPDLTRTAPIPLLFPLLAEALVGRAATLDFLVALGTHRPLTENEIDRLVGLPALERRARFPKVRILNHAWNDPREMERIGAIERDEVASLTGGLLSEDVAIVINRRILACDRILICGPVFPHEVVGFSGGNKYLFPGASGDAFLQFFHWLGAIITNPRINGNRDTPVRALIDRAARLLEAPRHALSFVAAQGGLAALFFGTAEASWAKAVEVSRVRHIRYVDRPYRSVLAEAPEMYDDIWTAGKCMYKLEPVLEDGGELIILAPHIDEISYSHGAILDAIGYHTRDYFLADWERFRRYPWGVVAHSTHVRGIGTMEGGIEKPRVTVTLATRIPEERCRRVSLAYRDPASIDREAWKNREDEGILYVPHAGETLFRLKDPPAWARVAAQPH